MFVRNNSSLIKAINQMKKGIKTGNYLVYAQKEIPGRFEEEINLNIFLQLNNIGRQLLTAKIFLGRGYYKPWIELFGITPLLNFDSRALKYFDSAVEEKILTFWGSSLGPGGKLYVEYEQDNETLYLLTHGFPISITRLGFKLFRNGFFWLKDWYFSEGYLEGSRKLEGEKPLDEKTKLVQIKMIKKEIWDFWKEFKKLEKNRYIIKALFRVKRLINYQ